MIVPLFDPEDGETVSQDWLLMTVQLVLEVMENGCDPLEELKLSDVVETVKLCPACVTFIVRITPPPVIVIVAVR